MTHGELAILIAILFLAYGIFRIVSELKVTNRYLYEIYSNIGSVSVATEKLYYIAKKYEKKIDKREEN